MSYRKDLDLSKYFTNEEYPREQAQALAYLKEHCKPETRVYSLLRHCSASGMQRAISFYVIEDNTPILLDRSLALLFCYVLSKHEGVKLNGCGMDMGYHVVNSLSAHLYKNVDGSYSHDGAYSLKHSWL